MGMYNIKERAGEHYILGFCFEGLRLSFNTEEKKIRMTTIAKIFKVRKTGVRNKIIYYNLDK